MVFYLKGPTCGEGVPGIEPRSSDPQSSQLPLSTWGFTQINRNKGFKMTICGIYIKVIEYMGSFELEPQGALIAHLSTMSISVIR